MRPKRNCRKGRFNKAHLTKIADLKIRSRESAQEVKIDLPRWFIVAGLLFILSFFAAVAWWLYSNPEGKIRATLQSGAQAVVNHDYPSAIKVFSPNYRDRSGLTFRDLQRMLLDWCRNKQNQLWLQQFSIEHVIVIDFWRAAALVKVQGIVSVEGFGTVSFGPIDLSVDLERTWWGRWRITSLNGWQEEPNIQQLIE
ncbi:MAG: hypothetical protein ACK4I8_11475 [Armatimonadota bacterium]